MKEPVVRYAWLARLKKIQDRSLEKKRGEPAIQGRTSRPQKNEDGNKLLSTRRVCGRKQNALPDYRD